MRSSVRPVETSQPKQQSPVAASDFRLRRRTSGFANGLQIARNAITAEAVEVK